MKFGRNDFSFGLLIVVDGRKRNKIFLLYKGIKVIILGVIYIKLKLIFKIYYYVVLVLLIV